MARMLAVTRSCTKMCSCTVTYKHRLYFCKSLLGKKGMACMNLSDLFVCTATVFKSSHDRFVVVCLNKMKI